jgi:hypothetical protein
MKITNFKQYKCHFLLLKYDCLMHQVIHLLVVLIMKNNLVLFLDFYLLITFVTIIEIICVLSKVTGLSSYLVVSLYLVFVTNGFDCTLLL